jgi:hypothetical protein
MSAGVTGQAGGVGDGRGDAGFAKAGLAEAEHVAVLLDEAAGHEFSDDSGVEFGSQREVEAVEAVDETEVGAFEAALEAALGSGIAFGAQQA